MTDHSLVIEKIAERTARIVQERALSMRSVPALSLLEADDDQEDELDKLAKSLGAGESDEKNPGGQKPQPEASSAQDKNKEQVPEKDPELRGKSWDVHKGDLPKPEDVTLEMVKDALNSVRSGQSLKNRSVADEMKHYFDKLAGEERLALWVFLKGLSQVMGGSAPGEDAIDPSDAGSELSIRSKEEDVAGQNGKGPPVQLPPAREQQAPEAQAKRRSVFPPLEDVEPPVRVVSTPASKQLYR